MYEVTLRRREPVAERTLAFYFDKPAGFSHDAGQNVMLSLIEPPAMDAAGPSRPFTLASAPHEPELMIATRMRDSSFKRHLGSVPLGTRLEDNAETHGRALGWRICFSRASKTASIGVPSPRSMDARLSFTGILTGSPLFDPTRRSWRSGTCEATRLHS